MLDLQTPNPAYKAFVYTLLVVTKAAVPLKISTTSICKKDVGILEQQGSLMVPSSFLVARPIPSLVGSFASFHRPACQTKGYLIPDEQNPTYEFFPSKGEFVTSQFMINAAPDNLFPHVFGMDNDNLFLSANGKSAILNWKTHEERMLPDLPEKV